MIGEIVSHYKILDKLGEGGMGVVYKAQDLKLDRFVALKFLPQHLTDNEEAKKRFIHEAKAASALDHPNICNIHEIDETPDGQMFIAMACYEGESLRDRLKAGPMDVGSALNIATQIATGLSKAHEKEIIHRDIKPANIIVTSEGEVKIVDFGLAKLEGRTKVTKTGTTMGTVGYMSPEQAKSESVDHRTDIWSFGVVLYEMLTGEKPFPGDHEAAVLYRILNEDPQPLNRHRPGLPKELQSVADRVLQKDVDERYQSFDELLLGLSQLRGEDHPGILAPQVSVKPRWRFLTSALAMLVVMVGLFVGVRNKIGPRPDAVAAENKLAIMYFENMVDPRDAERLGEIVTNLLITDLSESRYVQVVSSQRLYDILKLLEQEGLKVIDKDLASQVARKADAKWMLMGSILKIEPQLIVTSQLVEVASGNVVASQRIQGEAGEEIFSLIDEMTLEIKKDLSLPTKAINELDRPVAEVTTNSPEAYRHYLEGIEYQAKYYETEAEKSFRKAVEIDSTFAMAYLKLALYAWEDQEEVMAKAVTFSDRVSQKEKLYIKCHEAWLSKDYAAYVNGLNKMIERYPEEKMAYHKLGLHYVRERREYEKAIGYFNKAVEIDPLFKMAYNQLAYAYDRIGDTDKSIWAINKYIVIAPDEANPYDTRGDLYAGNGKIDRAIESYRKALGIKPDYYMSRAKLGHMYLFKREHARADTLYKGLLTSPEKTWRSFARTCLAIIPLYQGQFVRALQLLDDGIAADRMEQEVWSRADKHYLKAIIYEERNDLGAALKESKKCMETVIEQDPGGVFQWQDHYAYLLTKYGNVAEGEELLHALKRKIQDEDPSHDWAYGYYWFMAGKIEWAKGNLESAAIHFNKAKKANPRYDERFSVPFLLSRIYLELGRVGEAVAELEPALLRYGEDRAKDSINAVKAYYLLGLAYDQSGWRKKATEQYEEFLDIWKDADPGIAEVEDARRRLARLRQAG